MPQTEFFLIFTDRLHAWGFPRRRCLEMGEDGSLWVAPPEYVILRKLQYFKEGGSAKHIGDIQGMLDISGDRIDRAILDEWVSTLDLADEWSVATRDTPFA